MNIKDPRAALEQAGAAAIEDGQMRIRRETERCEGIARDIAEAKRALQEMPPGDGLLALARYAWAREVLIRKAFGIPDQDPANIQALFMGRYGTMLGRDKDSGSDVFSLTGIPGAHDATEPVTPGRYRAILMLIPLDEGM